MKTAVVTIGRMNPPTLGHLGLIRKMMLFAHSIKEKDIFIILSNTVDKKNPLSCDRKRDLLVARGMIDSIKTNPADKALRGINVHIFCMKDAIPSPQDELCGKHPIIKHFCNIVKTHRPHTVRLFIGEDRGGNYGFIGKYLNGMEPSVVFEEDVTTRREIELGDITTSTKSSDIAVENVSASLLRSLVKNNLPDLFIDLCMRAGLSRTDSRLLFEELTGALRVVPTKRESNSSVGTVKKRSKKLQTKTTLGRKKRKKRNSKRRR